MESSALAIQFAILLQLHIKCFVVSLQLFLAARFCLPQMELVQIIALATYSVMKLSSRSEEVKLKYTVCWKKSGSYTCKVVS